MKNKIIAGALVGAFMFGAVSPLLADVAKGQKLYSKKFKNACDMSGAKLAAKHSQDEWETIMEDGNLNGEIKSHCGKETKEKFLPHLYDFFYEYANDSGNVPSC